MASVQYGVIVTSLKGKVAGHVFQQGNGVQVLRTKGYNKGNRSDNRSKATNNLQRSTGSWKLLTRDQQAAWSTLAPSWIFTDKFGNPYTGSGYQVYNSYNTRLLAIGQPAVTTPTSAVEAFDPMAVAISELSTTTIDIAWANAIAANYCVLIYMSPPVSAGRSIRNLRMTLIAVDLTEGDTSILVTDAYKAVYGDYPVGSTIYVRIESRSLTYPGKSPSYTNFRVVG